MMFLLLCLKMGIIGSSLRVKPRDVYHCIGGEHVVSGIFELVCKMIAHSLVQGGPGFPYLAPVVYSYISAGDPEAALLHVSAVDVCDPALSSIIERVRL